MSSEVTFDQNKQNGICAVRCLTESRKDIELLSVKPLSGGKGFIVGVNVTGQYNSVSNEIWTFNADAQLTSRKSFGKIHENPNNPTQTCFVSTDPVARAIDNWEWETLEGSDEGWEELYQIEQYAPKIVRATLDGRSVIMAGSQLVVCDFAANSSEHITTPYYTMRDGDKALVGQNGEVILSPVALSSEAKKEAFEAKEHKSTEADSSGQSSTTTHGSATTLPTTLD